MGQENSTGRRGKEADFFGSVFVSLDSDTYQPGDTVQGNVYAYIKQPYPGDKICLKVKGKEYTKWIDKEARTRQKPDGMTETYYVDVHRESEIVNIKSVVTIYDWVRGAVLPPGQFTFPVQFVIPKGVPSSFFMRQGTAVGEIRYSVEAFIEPEHGNYPKIKHKRPIIIKQGLQGSVQTRELSINKKVSTCCCCAKGSVSMKTYFEKDAYAPGETARVVTEIDNSQCQLKVTNISFSLYQNVTLRAQGHVKSFNFPIRNLSLGSVEPGQSFVGDQRKEASLTLPGPLEGNAKGFKGSNDIQNFNLDPTQAISPSTNGQTVDSAFSLVVSCGMDGCICDALPATSLPIQVYSVLQQKIMAPIAPPGWNPQTMPTANLSITINVGGQSIQINQGGQQPNPNGMANNQMPVQPQQQFVQPQPQQNFGQPQPQPQMNQSFNPQQQQQQNFGQTQPQQQMGQPQNFGQPMQMNNQQQQGFGNQSGFNNQGQIGQQQVRY